jgi:hypothetical protein
MKRLVLALALALPLTFAATTASADKGAHEPTPTERSAAHVGDNSCATAKKAGRDCVIDFEDGDNVDGSRYSGDGDSVVADSPSKHPSLIKLRMNFVDKILMTANDVL